MGLISDRWNRLWDKNKDTCPPPLRAMKVLQWICRFPKLRGVKLDGHWTVLGLPIHKTWNVLLLLQSLQIFRFGLTRISTTTRVCLCDSFYNITSPWQLQLQKQMLPHWYPASHNPSQWRSFSFLQSQKDYQFQVLFPIKTDEHIWIRKYFNWILNKMPWPELIVS